MTKHTRVSLTWHCDHWCASPEHIHASGVAITERRVKADISQLATSHMLLFWGNRGEDDAVGRQAHVLGILLDVGLTHSWEAQQPENAVWHTFQNLKMRKETSKK